MLTRPSTSRWMFPLLVVFLCFGLVVLPFFLMWKDFIFGDYLTIFAVADIRSTDF